jgi:hypothetical protein
MRGRPLFAFVVLASIPFSSVARAQSTSSGEVPDDLPRLILDDARKGFAPREKGLPRFATWEAHGEIQIRGEHDSNLPLVAPASDPTLTSLGPRKNFLTEWVRVDSQITAGDHARFVVQLDLVPRWVLGDLAQGVGAAGDWADDTAAPSFARLRYAYLDVLTPIGLFRVGQQGSHWGLGLVANDGDHRRLFGDYRNGTIVERVAFATKPAGEASAFVVAVAADAVVRDANATWSDGDRAYQGVLAAYFERDQNFAGVYGVRRWQKVAQGFDPKGDLDVWVIDGAARTAAPIGETGNVFLFAAAEVAGIVGTTNAVRPTTEFDEQKIRSFGGAANLGVVRRAYDRKGRSFGSISVQLDGGYASGDANPYDDTIKRFTFDGNYTVGLVMFPFVMHFMTARAATNAMDPTLVARALPGTRFLPSRGGVFGAQYLNPTIVVRPTPDFDLKGGLVVAVSTSDVVDPYLTTTLGSARNYRGGDSALRDLGVELDYGFEWRVQVPPFSTAQIGFQGGVFFPGHAFDDANGRKMPVQAVEQLRLGFSM